MAKALYVVPGVPLVWKRPDLDGYEAQERVFLEDLSGSSAGDLLEPKNPAISPDATVRDLLFRMITERKLAFVIWRNGPHGVVTYQDVLRSFAAGESAKTSKVSEIVGQEGMFAVEAETPALPLLWWMIRSSVPMVAVFRGEKFLGIFTASSAFGQARESRKAAPL